ncbi:MFS transporter [Aquincola sp. S2]|uniref:MFS transporter n=1 Tax=Pseudaquabacterium terrae TaxID=2732868 RepID=A0ABX2E9R0_9BURK|nr:MFS transporter [Aquabacterium terrae]NRF65392.1 MFS transporter [Aquabacterium terrae]
MPFPPFVPALALTLVLSWGSLFYAFALMARPVQAELQAGATAVMGAYSFGLLVWGLATGVVGAVLQRRGGRAVMGAGSLLAGLAFIGLGEVNSIGGLYLAWGTLGAAMALTLYEPAFAVIVQACPGERRRFITALTLAGGLASAVFWPLTDQLVAQVGWRATALTYGLMHLGICAPLHALLLPRAATVPAAPPPTAAQAAALPRPRALLLLGIAFAANGFVTAALAVHVIPLLESRGVAPGAAVALATCIGPMQVAGRTLEFISGGALDARRLGLITLALIMLALSALWLAAWAPLLCGVFVISYGAGLGLMTIVRATTPLALFGPARYAALSGTLGMPALLARAAGPIGATWLLDRLSGPGALLLALLAIAACAAGAFAQAWAAGESIDKQS